MAFTHTTTGMTGRGTIVRGDVAWVSGTWASKSVSAGTIVTGGSLVLCHDVSVGSALITGGTASAGGSAIIHSNKNKSGVGDSGNGLIQVTSIQSAIGTAGDWWAIVV